jgi:hypothetical protein
LAAEHKVAGEALTTALAADQNQYLHVRALYDPRFVCW